MDIVAPFLPYDKLRTVATTFLETYHKDGEIPIPIERIIEFDFELDIVPIPGLKDQFDVDAYITNDLAEIRVDKHILEKSPHRYRFSLAHELSHFLLHKDLFESLQFASIVEWKRMIQGIPEDQYKWIEIQAYGLAGLILVPEAPLKAMFDDMKRKAAKAGVDIDDLATKELRPVLSSIARSFDVSIEVIEKRLRKDALIGP